MARENPELIRSATSPHGHNERNSQKDHKKAKSLTDRLRSTFSRSKTSTTHSPIKDTNEEITYGKIVVLGQAGVGKTSFIHRLVNNYFTEPVSYTHLTLPTKA